MSTVSEADKKVVVISGASDGIGLATADLFAKNGWIVYDLSRRGTNRAGVIHITADVTDDGMVLSAFENIYAKHNRVDAVIANAGFGISDRKSVV